MNFEGESSDEIQDRLEEEKSKTKKFESRYKHGGPMRSAKKKNED